MSEGKKKYSSNKKPKLKYITDKMAKLQAKKIVSIAEKPNWYITIILYILFIT